MINVYWGEAKELVVRQVMVEELPSSTTPLGESVIVSVGVSVTANSSHSYFTHFYNIWRSTVKPFFNSM